MIARFGLAAVLIGGFGLPVAGQPASARGEEPQFVGRTRQQWVAEYDAGGEQQRSHAAWALSQFAVQQAGAADSMLWLNQLVQLVESNSPTVRYWGLTGLGQFLGKLDADHLARATGRDALQNSLNDTSASARVVAAEALARLGKPQSALPVLVAAMQSPQESVRIQATSALASLGETARPALPTLQRATTDDSEYVKRIASRAIARLTAK
jgi:HEAT repeat protein